MQRLQGHGTGNLRPGEVPYSHVFGQFACRDFTVASLLNATHGQDPALGSLPSSEIAARPFSLIKNSPCQPD